MHVDAVNILDLNSVNDSTITNLNLYSRQAQITRVFKFDVAAGQNKVVISGLPNVLDHGSLRYTVFIRTNARISPSFLPEWKAKALPRFMV